ncbi:hypothetical protein Sjap_016695 [Stephania japonica]|uniref:S-acyltransferase n=1 Tax=Stephania japonica TaxID=461633 RepID=A0AAP0ILH6_9MAGN
MQGKMYSSSSSRSTPHLSDSNRRIINNNNNDKRLYQVWKGSNKFFLEGRLVFGPDVRSLPFTIFLIAAPVVFFCIFVSQRLINQFQHIGNLIVAFPAVFTVFIIIILFITSGRDPGIIPRNLHPPEPEDEGNSSSMYSAWLANRGGVAANVPPTKDVSVNGTIVKVKYCHTCMLHRPPRCSHCSICNNCVERFDHHCPWVGQCIGKRNYRFFFIFISSTTVLCLYVFSFCWVNIRKIMESYHCNLWKALLKSPVSGVLILYTFIAAWFVGGLTAFHVYLICTNQTTYENFRYRYDGKMNPYNLGLVRNIGETLFSEIPPSKNHFRANVKENSISAFPSSVSMGRIMSPEVPKRSFDVEMGAKRQTVAEEELEDIQNHIDSVAGLDLERCGTEPRHTNWNHKSNWEITPDLHELAAEFRMQQGITERKKIAGIL